MHLIPVFTETIHMGAVLFNNLDLSQQTVKELVCTFVAALPRCDDRDCRGLLRPNVVFFGETLDSHILTKVEKEMEVCDLCLVVSYPPVFPYSTSDVILLRKSNIYSNWT